MAEFKWEHSVPRPGWGAVLSGEKPDIADWVYVLKDGFDPSVDVLESETVLRSSLFDSLESAEQVRDAAIATIDRLNGAVALSQGGQPVGLRGVIQFAPDGRLHRTMFAETGVFRIRGMKLRAFGTVIGSDGKPVDVPPQPSEVQNWNAVAQHDKRLNNALIHFGRATDWLEVFKCIECLEDHVGGEAALKALDWVPKRDLVRLKRSANQARHASGKFDPPKKALDLREARTLLGNLLRHALNHRTKAS